MFENSAKRTRFRQNVVNRIYIPKNS